MTMKPKAEKYRIRKPAATADLTSQAETAVSASPQTETGAEIPDKQRIVQGQTNQQQSVPNDPILDAIRQEGLNARQLRTARRVAEKHGLPFASDFEAVKVLRDRGIDPFQRNNLMDMVTTKQDGKISLPQKITPSQVPAEISKDKDMSPAERRALEVSQIQKDLGRRRRRNIFFLTLRLIAFILLPTFIAGYYYAFVASPMYSTKSSFQIIKSGGSSGGGAGGLGGMLAGTGFATTTEAIAVQTFLMSKTAMIRLDEDAGFKQHFSAPNIDPIHQLEPDATNESAFKVYKKRLKIGFDPTEGMVNMEVITADPQTGVEFSNALITYGEEVVDGLSARSKENQVADAKKALDEAMEERRLAQESLIDLQSSTMLDPEAYAGSLRGQISSLEQQIVEKKIELDSLLDNLRPNKSRVDGVRSDIDRLNSARIEIEEKMQAPLKSGMTLAQLLARIQMAQQDLATRDMMVQSALEQVRGTQAEAAAQSLYLELAVKPVAAEDASYPRVFEDTVIVFLILCGIYLMVSITSSILREQVG